MSHRRNTVQRQLIIDAVKELDIHATAEQVYEHITQKHPSIGRATVYRNLGQMSESGELMKICSCQGSTHYDHRCHVHHHFICDKCKRVFDVETDFSDVFDRTKDAEGFDVSGYHISFHGLCWKCKNMNET